MQLLQGRKVERVPVWAMRQAGRTLASYRRLREKVGNFRHMVRTPELATEVTLLPVQVLGTDAAIIFSDILSYLRLWASHIKWKRIKGLTLRNYLQCAKDVKQLRPVVVEESLAYVA